MDGGEKIRELRKQKRLTLRQLAKVLDINFTYLSKIENMSPDEDDNPTIPSANLIVRIANALDADPDELLLLYEKVPSRVEKWPRQEGFQEFYRSLDSRELTADEWKILKEHLKKIRNKKVHKDKK